MSSIQSDAERKFYHRLLTLTTDDIKEMKYNDTVGTVTRGADRVEDLSTLLKEFFREMRNNLLSLSKEDKTLLLDEYLQYASPFKEQWIKDKNKYASRPPGFHWMRESKDIDLLFIGKVVDKLDALKSKIKPPKDQNDKAVDPLSFIDPDFIDLFLRSEAKATDGTAKFTTAIRCAAFVELLYDRKYLVPVKNLRQQTMIRFAKCRYHIDIKNALAASKNPARQDNKTRAINGKPPLNKSF